jgi:hypothetical protein
MLVATALMSVAASAGTITLSGTGASGVLSAPSETWVFNADGGASVTGYLNDWGSPGVDLGTVPSDESVDLFGLQMTFLGGSSPIDAASITTGNGAACEGTTTGGTTFCTINPTDIWVATQVGPDSIDFLAQSASYYLTPGQQYFVNIFFDGATPTGFTGDWLTTFTPTPPATTPEPAAFGLVGVGLASLLAISRRQR